MNTKTVTANYTVTTEDRIILADATAGPITITTPPAIAKKEYKKDRQFQKPGYLFHPVIKD